MIITKLWIVIEIMDPVEDISLSGCVCHDVNHRKKIFYETIQKTYIIGKNKTDTRLEKLYFSFEKDVCDWCRDILLEWTFCDPCN